MLDPLILAVTGASGKQGSALISSLLHNPVPQRKLRIRAIVRDTQNPRCEALKKAAARSPTATLTIHSGDFSDPSSLAPILAGASALFLNTSPTSPNAHDEVEHAQNIVDAAESVRHIIYASVVGVDDPEILDRLGGTASWATPYLGSDASVPEPDYTAQTPVRLMVPMEESMIRGLQGYFSAKYEIEQRVKAWSTSTSFPSRSKSSTILRPAWFMTDFLPSDSEYHWPELSKTGILRTAMAPTDKLMLVAPKDIGRIASKVFLQAWASSSSESLTDWNGRTINIGSQVCDMQEIARALTNSGSGRSVGMEYLGREEAVREVRDGNRFREVQAWYMPRQACFDCRALEEMFDMRLTRFEEFVEEEECGQRQP